MKVGYIRVSDIEQNEARQVEAMKVHQVDKTFTEKISGVKNRFERPQLSACIDYVREGDVLYVESISRLGRSTLDLLSILEHLGQKGVGFVSLKEQWDTTSPQGKLITTIFAALATFEREQMKQRQLEGIAIAKLEGKYKGRQRKNIEQMNLFDLWDEGKITATDACRQLDISRNTFYRRIKELGYKLKQTN